MPTDAITIAPVTVPVALAVVGLFLGNIGFLIGAYVSLRVAIAKLEVKVDRNSTDIDGLGSIFRNNKGA